MKDAIVRRLDDLIATAGKLKATVAAERPDAPLPAFSVMRLGLDVDGMVTALQGCIEHLIPHGGGRYYRPPLGGHGDAGHLERLIPQPEGNHGKSAA
jgi:hypothetical protein